MQYKIPTCKLCGQKGHHKYQCFQNPKRKQAIKRKYSEYKAGKTPKRDKVLSFQSLNRKKLIVELDKYCSLITRIKASDKYGVVSCYTCGRRLPWKMTDCSHLISRQWLGTRFDFDNMRSCCQSCNRVLHGNLVIYRKNLINEIGEERVNRLNLKKSTKLSTVELDELLQNIKQQYRKLIEERLDR